MKKKLLAILTSVLMLCATLPLGVVNVSAATSNGYTYTISNNEATITDYSTSPFYGGDIVIPSTLGGYLVTSIGDGAFSNCTSLTSVTIPNSVTSIGDYAFNRCTGLPSITIPDSVITIGRSVFSECDGLTSINVMPNNPKYCSLDGVLFNQDKTTLVIYPNGRNGTYTIPNSVTAIGDGAFYKCSNLTSVTIPNSVTTIGDDAFGFCTNLVSVTIPDSVTHIGIWAFYECASLTSVTIPNSVTNISDYAFYYCYRLTSVTIPNSVTSIGIWAFHGCIDLTSVTILDSVTNIGYAAFDLCTSLTDVYYSSSEDNKANITIGDLNAPFLNATWHYNYINPKNHFSTTVDHSVMDTENGNGLAFRFELSAKGVAKKNGTEVDLSNATVNYLGQDCKLIEMGSVITNDESIANGNLTREQSNGQRVIDIPVVYLQETTDTSCAFATRLINIPDNQLERTIYARPYYIVEVDGEEIVVYGDVDAASCAEYM